MLRVPADASTLENHADREEVREALLSQAGESERYSATLAETTFYHAQRLPDGTVLRTARTQRSVLLLLLDMAPALLAVLAATAAVAGVLSAGIWLTMFMNGRSSPGKSVPRESASPLS